MSMLMLMYTCCSCFLQRTEEHSFHISLSAIIISSMSHVDIDDAPCAISVFFLKDLEEERTRIPLMSNELLTYLMSVCPFVAVECDLLPFFFPKWVKSS